MRAPAAPRRVTSVVASSVGEHDPQGHRERQRNRRQQDQPGPIEELACYVRGTRVLTERDWVARDCVDRAYTHRRAGRSAWQTVVVELEEGDAALDAVEDALRAALRVSKLSPALLANRHVVERVVDGAE